MTAWLALKLVLLVVGGVGGLLAARKTKQLIEAKAQAKHDAITIKRLELNAKIDARPPESRAVLIERLQKRNQRLSRAAGDTRHHYP